MQIRQKTVCVIGGINLDIKGVAQRDSAAGDSNLGKTYFTPGGVARNISENLARLGVNVYLLGCIGDDDNGRFIIEETKKSSVYTDNILISNEVKTSTYISLSDAAGNLDYAVNDMQDSLDKITKEYIEDNIELLETSKLIAIDTNLNADVFNLIIQIANKKNIPVFIDTVSKAKSEVIKNIQGRVDYLSPNLTEYENIFRSFDMDVINQKLETQAFDKFEYIIVKRGEAGISLINVKKKNVKLFHPIKLEAVEPNGAGDAFNAGFIFGVLNNYDIYESVQLGISAAYFALKTTKSVPEDLNKENLLKVFNRKAQSDSERF